MKFKLKATAQDWFIFGAFAVILLFLVALVITNIASFASGAGLTLDIADAFVNHLAALLLFYLLAVVFLVVSVKSYFFEQEKGLGFFIGEKEQKGGYSRWAKDKEIKEGLESIAVQQPAYNAAGFPIINDGTTIYVDDGDSHNLVIGSTGSGKTQCIIHPLVKILAKRGESMIVTDPKGEIYRESAGLLKQRGYKIVVLNFREPQQGNTWNPLALPYNLYKNGNTDKAMELLDDLATNILYEENGAKDPFWEKTSADYFAGLALGLFEDAKEEEVNINSISLMATVGEEKFGARSTYIKEYFADKNPASAAYQCASGTIVAPEETKASILSTFKQKIRLFASRENLSEMLSRSDFDMFNIGKQKTAIFMVIHDEKKTYHALATIFIKQCYESLIDVAQHSPKGELPIRTNFILDEFANMPPLKDITTMITAARSRRIRFTMIIQNFAQLDSVYGHDDALTVRSNCNNTLYLITTELGALKEISELCGEIKVKVGKGDKEHEETRPLVTVSDLQKMKEFEAIILRIRENPYKTKLMPNFKLDWNLPKVAADPFVQRQKQEVKVFDIKEFVKAKRTDKFMNMMNPDAPIGNPFANMPSINPFAQMEPKEMDNKQESITSNKPFDFEAIAKKIDQRIAELEEEERAEEEKKKKEELAKKQATTIEQPIINKEIITPTQEPQSNVTEIHKQSVTDDQFFDDFFDE